MLWQSKRFKIQNMSQYGQLQESRDEKQIAREEQKRILDSIPETDADADLPEVGDAKNEMSEAAIKSSPVWRFFKRDPDDENLLRCQSCDKVCWTILNDLA